MKWSRDAIAVGSRSFPSATHLPVLVYPNPIARPVTWSSTAGSPSGKLLYLDYSMPTLGDIAVLQVQADSDAFSVPFAGFFDESWGIR